MKIAVLTNLYPSAARPRHGIFIEHRVRRIHASGQAQVRVIAPVPYFPFRHAAFGAWAEGARVPNDEVRHGIHVVYPRYTAVPKIGMSSAPALLAAAMIKPFRRMQESGFDPDAIDAYYLYPDGVAATLLARYFGKPIVLTALGSDVNIIPGYRVPRQMIRWAGAHAARITTVSHALKARLVDIGLAADKIVPVLHGVDQEVFQPPDDRDGLRARLGLTRPTLLSVGNLIELKGNHLAIQALAELPEFELLIAGQGPEESALRRLAAKLGLAGRVRFLGLLHQQQLRDYYGAADALVLASSNEGIPNVLLESLACGTPVVATAVGGIPHIVESPEAGKLMTERSVAALVAAVRGLFAAYPDRAATPRQVQHLTWDRTTQEHLDVVRAALADHGTPQFA